MWWKLHDPNFNRFWLIHPCDGQTDRRTDRQTDGQTDGIAIAYARLAYMLSRAKTLYICRYCCTISFVIKRQSALIQFHERWSQLDTEHVVYYFTVHCFIQSGSLANSLTFIMPPLTDTCVRNIMFCCCRFFLLFSTRNLQGFLGWLPPNFHTC